jgi:hypothetical protein
MTESLARALRTAAQFAACRARTLSWKTDEWPKLSAVCPLLAAARFSEALLEHFGPAVAELVLSAISVAISTCAPELRASDPARV